MTDDGRILAMGALAGLAVGVVARGSRGVVRAGRRADPMRPGSFRVVVKSRNGREDEVRVFADGVDRPEVCAWVVGSEISERFKRAIEADVVLEWKGISIDINGQTYWSTSSKVLTRLLDEDLTRLGF
jgi:hypothetical protein